MVEVPVHVLRVYLLYVHDWWQRSRRGQVVPSGRAGVETVPGQLGIGLGISDSAVGCWLIFLREVRRPRLWRGSTARFGSVTVGDHVINLEHIVVSIADILKDYDAESPSYRDYEPGIGPLDEPRLCKRIAEQLSVKGLHGQEVKASFSRSSHPDLAIEFTDSRSENWALEIKLARPFGNNGKPSTPWLGRLLDPYSRSLLIDARLLAGRDPKKSLEVPFRNKAVVAIGYEHDPPKVNLDKVFSAFEVLAQHLFRITLGERVVETRSGLVHSEHQTVRCAGWQVLDDVA